ncbi:class I SAM-dependent methyltransferase [Geoalkalibacter sp.]|uniref:class I SAM-dependent methyltransferase n=1 Tax=Geoalkalibacter sp. TaxID=3041440 RepID=UPI00272E4403|nr:methyltransferase domain-containing protein [Geoalkalibacter sp.]
MNEDAVKWNERWQERAQDPWQPDPWLLRIRPLLPVGPLLDLACGRGRNALYLAEQGFAVTALDLAEEGLRQLRAEARRRNLTLDVRRCDLETLPDLGRACYAVVLDFFYLQRSLLPALREAVRPGGVAVLRTFSRAGDFPGEAPNADFVLEVGELPRLFPGWEVLLHEEGLEPSSKGGSLAGIVARKPLS